MEIKATINYGEPLELITVGGDQELTLKRGKNTLVLGWDEVRDIFQICKMMEWEDF